MCPDEPGVSQIGPRGGGLIGLETLVKGLEREQPGDSTDLLNNFSVDMGTNGEKS